MKVILLKKVPGLGDIDDVKEVAEGYARNFLFPRHLAVQASPKAMQDVEAHHKKIAKEAEQELRSEQSLAERVDGYELEIAERANEKGVLFAAVTAEVVAKALSKAGFAVDKKQLGMKPIKEVGTYGIKIKLKHGLEADVTVIVVAK